MMVLYHTNEKPLQRRTRMATNKNIKACVDYMIKNYPDAFSWKITSKSLVFEIGEPAKRKVIPLTQIPGSSACIEQDYNELLTNTSSGEEQQ